MGWDSAHMTICVQIWMFHEFQKKMVLEFHSHPTALGRREEKMVFCADLKISFNF